MTEEDSRFDDLVECFRLLFDAPQRAILDEYQSIKKLISMNTEVVHYTDTDFTLRETSWVTMDNSTLTCGSKG